MDIQGRIIEVCPVQSGVGKNSGREWSSQEFVIEYNENTQYPRQACLRIFGSDRIAEFNVQVGEYVQVAYDVESSKYNERWYTRLNAYRLTRMQPGVPPHTIQDAPANIQQQYYNQQQYQQPMQPQQPMYQQPAPQYQPQYQQPVYQQPAAPQSQPAVNAPVVEAAAPQAPQGESEKYDTDLPF